MNRNESLRIGVCVFALNEEDNIQATLDSVTNGGSDSGLIHEICVIDDGSTDRTSDLVTEYASNHSAIRLIRHSRNLGPAQALRTGVQAMSSEYILLLPGDHTYDQVAVERVLRLRQETPVSVALILGSRVPGRTRRSMAREIAARLARAPLELANVNSQPLPSVGLILFQRSMALRMPRGVIGYGQGIGLLGTLLISGASFRHTPIDQVPGSERRGSRLTPSKVMDVARTYYSLLLSWKELSSLKDPNSDAGASPN